MLALLYVVVFFICFQCFAIPSCLYSFSLPIFHCYSHLQYSVEKNPLTFFHSIAHIFVPRARSRLTTFSFLNMLCYLSLFYFVQTMIGRSIDLFSRQAKPFRYLVKKLILCFFLYSFENAKRYDITEIKMTKNLCRNFALFSLIPLFINELITKPVDKKSNRRK